MTQQSHPRGGAAPLVQRVTPRQAYARAVDLHRAGRLAEAEKIYQGLLQLDRDHVGALQNLGVIRMRQGRGEDAVALIGRAVELDPDAADARNDLGMALAMLRRFEDAAAQYRSALELRPELAAARNNLANALIALNRADEAVAQLEQALAAQPRSADLHYNLGNALVALERHEQAVACYRAALALRPDFAQAHHNLGGALAALGRPGQSVAHYEQAIALQPDFVDALRNLGNALLARNRPDLALDYLRRALALRPGADSHGDLANAFAMLERNQDAIAHYEKALAESPSSAAIHNNLGNTLVTVGRREEGAAHLQKALALIPDYPEALSNLGNAFLQLHRVEDAVACFERALALRPDMAQAHNGLGIALQALGRLEQAQQATERAIALAPRSASYYHALSSMKRFSPGDPHLVAMQALGREMQSLRPTERIALHFALGKAYADLGEHERAFRCYVEGNALNRARVAYDETPTLAGFERLKQIFTADLMRSRAGRGDPSEIPIFIVGMPRSGTTLVEQILASHGQVFAGGEMQVMGRLAASIRRADGTHGFPELVPNMSDEQLRAFGARYVADIRRLSPAAARITDKMPGNFYFAGLIRLALPNARIVHVQRDPVDTCLSLFTHYFPGELEWSYDLREVGRYYGAYVSLMAHWRAVLPPGAMLDVRYEDLVGDFEPQARRLLAYCGLAWDERCLAFHKTERPVWTASVAQVRQPVYRAAIGRAGPYMPMLGPLLEALGDSR